MKRPTHAFCDGERITIEWTGKPSLKGRFAGEYVPRRRLIRMTTGSAEKARVTLMHELLHDAADRGGLETASPTVERVLDAVDSFILALLRESPEVRRFLFDDTLRETLAEALNFVDAMPSVAPRHLRDKWRRALSQQENE